MLKKYLSEQRGQVSILFALLMPIFLLFAGVALDLGWYYLNVSRLQNAADAAAVAGAKTLIGNENFSAYKNISLVDKYPARVSNEYRPNDTSEEAAIENGEEVARDYVDKNLASAKYGSSVDAWTKAVFLAEPLLYEQDDNLYYVVKIREEIRHFFLPGWFDDMNAPVTAVALLSKSNSNSDVAEAPTIPTPAAPTPVAPVKPEVVKETIVDALEKAKQENVIIGNWEIQNRYKDINNPDTNPLTGVQDEKTGEWLTAFNKHFGYNLYTGSWNQYSDGKNHYTSGDHRRTETINVKTTPGNGSSLEKATKANGNRYYLADEVDSLNIDFKADVYFKSGSKYLKEDWDLPLGYNSNDIEKLRFADWDSPTGKIKDDTDKIDTPAASLRIHSTINFEENFPVRAGAEDSTDILWVRIESEPMLNKPDTLNGADGFNMWVKNSLDTSIGSELSKEGIRVLNSVRQLIINMNSDNTGTNSDGYKYRPVAIFYDGPERYSTSNDLRDSKPVIVNLNADFNGILYLPNSSVVLNHGENLNGFIVAKEYLTLKTFTANSEGKYLDSNGKEYFKISETHNGVTNTMFIDDKGEVQYESTGYDFNRSVGTYNTFGRTEFKTHDYIINQSSAKTLLITDEEE